MSPTSPSPVASPPTFKRHASLLAGLLSDPPAVASFKRRLLIDALGTSPRLRNDLELMLIHQHLQTVDALLSVSWQALHYLATECRLVTLNDGDVFCYQDDAVKDDACALLILEGSLCGYVNRAFSQRDDRHESFTAWNARQNKRRGVLVDFGEIQATFAAGALCGFDDLLVSVESDANTEPVWRRRRGVHAQEFTRAISFPKDLLDRAATRFGLSWDRGVVLCQKDIALMDISHLALFTQLPSSDQQSLLSSARRVVLRKNDLVFTSSQSTITSGGDDQTQSQQRSSSRITSLAVVVCGRLDLYWTGEVPSLPPAAAAAAAPASDGRKTASAADDAAKTLLKSPLVTIRRGQSIGEQTLGLSLDTHSPSVVVQQPSATPGTTTATQRVLPAQQFANELPVRIVAGDDNTELLLISRQLYEARRQEFQITQSYIAAMRSLALSTDTVAPHRRSLVGEPVVASVVSPFERWAPSFFAKKPPRERDAHDVCELAWRLRTDRILGKAFFQFPPLVLERLCHAMELAHTLTDSVVHCGLVVVKGALRSDGATEHIPGDLLIATKKTTVEMEHPDALVLVLPMLVVERWWTPVATELVTTAGSVFRSFHQLSTASRQSSAGEIKRKSFLARQIDAASASTGEGTSPSDVAVSAVPAFDSLAMLLQRMDLFTVLPRFLLRTALGGNAMLLHRRAGDVLFQENEYTTALVLVVSGFVAFYSLEHLNATLEMFRRHPLCHFTSLHHVLSKAADLEDASSSSSSSALRSSANGVLASPAKTRTALSGVHLQTLHVGNVFRTGVLHDATVSPATVIAQTDVELLVLNEAACSELLRHHSPAIDFSRFEAPLSRRSSGSNVAVSSDTIPEAAAPTSIEMQRPIVLSQAQNDNHHFSSRVVASSSPTPALLKFLETQQLPGLPVSVSDAKRQLVLREMRVVTLAPGELVLRHGDVVSHTMVVLSGSLAVYVRPNVESAARVLDASQRSVRSLMLERHVTSNYATTSSQLSTLRDVRQRQQKRALLQHKMNRMLQRHAEDTDDADATASATREKAARGLFVQSVLVALNESKRRQEAETHEEPAVVALAKPPTASKAPRSRRSVFRAVVSKAQFQHRIDESRRQNEEPSMPGNEPQPSGTTAPLSSPEKTRVSPVAPVAVAASTNEGGDERLLLCHLVPGDIYAEEALDAASALRSRHDVVVEPPHAVSLLCLDRRKLHAILARTDDAAEQELRGRSNAAKSKWKLAEQRLVRRRSETEGGRTGSSSMPKLMELFRNVLNQRFYLTMRAIAEIPLLRELPDHAKRDLCMATRFEALERFGNAYKDAETRRVLPSNAPREAATGDRRPRYFFVVSGRIGVFPRSNALLSATQLALSAAGATANTSGNGASGSSFSSSSSGNSRSGGPSGNTSSAAAANVLTAHMDQCLVDVGPTKGFGEFEILVPEASRHALLAIALEPTKLLSFPADCFLKWWPTVQDMQRNIAYVRHEVPYFSRLDLDKISCLYLSLRFQSVARGAKIWEQHEPLSNKEVHFLKEGECTIKTRITVQAPQRPDGDPDVDPDADAADGAAAATAPHNELRVLATIADVQPGHIFWLDGSTAPFTLVAVSARVTIATITAEKLRAILSKTPFLELEDMSERLAARYREQLEVARATLVRVMNEKRNAELGRSSRATFLPSLHFVLQAESKKSQLQRLAHGSSGRHARELRARRLVHRRGHRNGPSVDGDAADDDNGPSALSHAPVPPDSSVIPYGRVLASRPIEIKSLTARRDQDKQVQSQEPTADDGASATQSHAVLRWHESPLDVAYASQHLQEHYELPRASALGETELSVSTALRGSFDSSRVRSLRVTHALSPSTPLSPRSETTNETSTVTESPQQQALAPMRPSSGDCGDLQRRSLPMHRLRVEVVVPEPIPAPASSQEAKEPQNSTPIGRRSVVFQDTAPAVSCAETLALTEGIDDDIDAVIDVRQFLMAEMQAAFAPLRSIRLEPSQCKLNSLGKYLPPPVVPTEPNLLDRKKTPRRSGLSSPPASSVTTPSRQDLQQMKRLSGASASVRESRRLAIVLPTFSRWRKQEPAKSKRPRQSPRELEPLDRFADNQNCVTVVRRQGFLEIAEIPHAALPEEQQQQQVPTQRRRRYFSVIDDHLLEFSESVDVHALRHARPHACHSLVGATLRDAPQPGSLSGSDALLRHSFVLSLSLPPTDFLLTAESLMDRKQWMQALRDGVNLGAPPTVLRGAQTIPNGLPGSPQYRHRHTIAKIIADQHRERRRLTLLNLLGSNTQASGVDQVLEVDYRIN